MVFVLVVEHSSSSSHLLGCWTAHGFVCSLYCRIEGLVCITGIKSTFYPVRNQLDLRKMDQDLE